MELICHWCRDPFIRDRRVYNKGVSRGQQHFFCSKQCADEYQGSLSTPLIIPKGKKYCINCKKIITAKQLAQRENGRIRGLCKKCLYIYQYKRWNKRKVAAIKLLGGKCHKCGVPGHPVIFDFHHKDPNEKEFDWNRLRRKSWDKILKEINKCELLCAVCHRLTYMNPDMWDFLPP